jgi:L-iditol 2-dehydrogenase
MKAAILEDKHKVVVQDIDDLSPLPDQILIKTEYAGICGSDLHAYEGRHPFRKPPVVLGHELSGTVVGIGDNVAGFQTGDRVTVMPLEACGSCMQCQRHKKNLCINKRLPGMDNWHGTFAEYFLALPEQTFKLGKETSLQKGALAEPLAIAIHSVRRVQKSNNMCALILGAGTIGILTAVVAKLLGAQRIAITDLYAYNLNLAENLSGSMVYNANHSDLVGVILNDHPQKFDAVFICAGVPPLVDQSLSLVAAGGTIVVTGLFSQPVTVDLTKITLNELNFIGTVLYDPIDFQTAVEWLDSSSVSFEKIISHVFPLDQVQSAMELAAGRREDFMKILLEISKT